MREQIHLAVAELLGSPEGSRMPFWEACAPGYKDLVEMDLATFRMETNPTGIFQMNLQRTLCVISASGESGIERELAFVFAREDGVDSPLAEMKKLVDAGILEVVKEPLRFRLKN